jgi:hypothetical protein
MHLHAGKFAPSELSRYKSLPVPLWFVHGDASLYSPEQVYQQRKKERRTTTTIGKEEEGKRFFLEQEQQSQRQQ